MNLTQPRIEPLTEEEWDEETRSLMEQTMTRGRVLNIFRTLAVHPGLLKRWLVFANHVLFKSTLSARDREILILRIGWLCQAEYEWGQHVIIAREAGLTNDEIERIKAGSEAEGWNESEALLLSAVDELRAKSMISDPVWKKLTGFYDNEQLLDIIFTAGQYNLVSMALNSLGVQLDDGIPGFESVPQK